jgi:formylglycine-generating enzyme required for sulfatase activity
MTVIEVYEKYKRIDKILSDSTLVDCLQTQAQYDMWQAIREAAKKESARQLKHDSTTWDIVIFGVVQRMRWIPAGTFLMGSPSGEPERFGDETQHEVTLTQGFWLADTACTQELWEAVMGSNPSRFKGADNPVEQVSWQDCQEFLRRANAGHPGLGLRLPTEAEWEYACRAGTTTPFSFGSSITTDLANYDGNYDSEYNSAKGVYRETTVPVKEFTPNALGLYQMHGNVWEWCADWYGDYPTDSATDPAGPDTGEVRVLRGGSWIDCAGALRSAFRFVWPPVDRDVFCGFRLSRGQ